MRPSQPRAPRRHENTHDHPRCNVKPENVWSILWIIPWKYIRPTSLEYKTKKSVRKYFGRYDTLSFKIPSNHLKFLFFLIYSVFPTNHPPQYIYFTFGHFRSNIILQMYWKIFLSLLGRHLGCLWPVWYVWSSSVGSASQPVVVVAAALADSGVFSPWLSAEHQLAVITGHGSGPSCGM